MTLTKRDNEKKAFPLMTINIGKSGINDNVIEEIKRHLKATKNVQLRFAKGIAINKDDYISDIVSQTKSKLIDIRGNVAVIYKRS